MRAESAKASSGRRGVVCLAALACQSLRLSRASVHCAIARLPQAHPGEDVIKRMQAHIHVVRTTDDTAKKKSPWHCKQPEKTEAKQKAKELKRRSTAR